MRQLPVRLPPWTGAAIFFVSGTVSLTPIDIKAQVLFNQDFTLQAQFGLVSSLKNQEQKSFIANMVCEGNNKKESFHLCLASS